MSAPRRRPQRGPRPEIPARRRPRRRSRRRPLLVVLLVVTGLLTVVALAAGAGVYTFGSSCDLKSLREVRIGQNTFVYAADGSLLGSIPAERNRQVVPIASVSAWMPKATVAIEDRRFYSHGGIDPQGIARAIVADAKARSVVQGGSTITQQLVRNLYISNERTIQRKLKEACLALKLNDAWSKERILESYLNQVYYGNLAYGIEAAAQTYFSKPARRLNLRESALLAGLTQAPSAYDPFAEPAKALARRNAVLDAMREQGVITAAQYRRARGSKDLALKPGSLYKEIREPYFFGYVRDQLIREYGTETVRSGGLSVYTTIIPRWQRAAQDAIRETLTEPGRSRRRRDLDRSCERRHPRDGGGRAGPQEQPVQSPLAGAEAARIDLQDVRSRGRDRKGNRPGHELLRLGPVHLQARPGRQLRRRFVVVREDVRLHLQRVDIDLPCHASIGQFGVRAAHARRRARTRG